MDYVFCVYLCKLSSIYSGGYFLQLIEMWFNAIVFGKISAIILSNILFCYSLFSFLLLAQITSMLSMLKIFHGIRYCILFFLFENYIFCWFHRVNQEMSDQPLSSTNQSLGPRLQFKAPSFSPTHFSCSIQKVGKSPVGSLLQHPYLYPVIYKSHWAPWPHISRHISSSLRHTQYLQWSVQETIPETQTTTARIRQRDKDTAYTNWRKRVIWQHQNEVVLEKEELNILTRENRRKWP